MLSNTVFAMKTKKDSTRKRKFRMHLRNRFVFSYARTAWRDLPTRAGCPVLDSVLLLFLKHTNIWFSYKVPFKFLSLAPTDDPRT